MTRLLIIDNDSEQLASIRAAALNAGFASREIDEAASAGAALELIANGPDIAVVDLHLGNDLDPSGVRIIRHIHESHPDCRIIALTNRLGNSEGVQALANGADHFINGKWKFVSWPALLTEQLSIYKALHEEAAFPL